MIHYWLTVIYPDPGSALRRILMNHVNHHSQLKHTVYATPTERSVQHKCIGKGRWVCNNLS